MATARIRRPTKTNRPTRNSDQVSCLPRAMLNILRGLKRTIATTIQDLNQKFSKIRILCRGYLLRTALEINAPTTQHQKARGRPFVLPPLRPPPYVARFGIETKIGERETVLEAMR